MPNDAFDPQVTSLVRQFSLGLPDDEDSLPIEQALVVTANAVETDFRRLSEAHSFEEWLEFKYPSRYHALMTITTRKALDSIRYADHHILSDDDTRSLQLQCMKIAALWRDFGHRFHSDPRGNSLPSVEALFHAVESAADDFHQKRTGTRGKFVDGFESFVGTLCDHSYLFSIIPDDDKYLSLVTGVLTSIAKVSTNRRTITEAFALELGEIREELIDVPKICDVGNAAQMKPRVVKLYIRIFEFLHEAMCWYQSKSKRFKGYLNENYYSRHFQPLTANIRKAISSIRHGAELITQQKVGYLVDRVDRNLVNRIAGDDIRYESPLVIEERGMRMLEGFKQIGRDAMQTLNASGEQFFYDQQMNVNAEAASMGLQENQLGKEQVDEDFNAEVDICNNVSRNDLRRQADHVLARFADDGREELKNILRGTASPMIPDEVSARIQSWIQNKSSQFLWVEGPVATDSGSSLSLTALRICELTMQAEMPCVSFFCKRKYKFASPESRMSGTTLMALLYTVMDQLINLLPSNFVSTPYITLDSLERSPLGGDTAASAALDVIEMLLSHAPPAVTFVIDGLEIVNHMTEIPHLLRLVELLRTEGSNDRVFKALLTTNGNSRALGKAIGLKERVDGTRFAQGRPGRPLRGASHISDIAR